MGKIQLKIICAILLLLITGCNSPITALQDTSLAASQTPIQSTQGIPSVMSTPEEPGTQNNSPTQASFSLSEPGPFFAGKHTYTVRDERRNGREIHLAIYYPAIKHIDADGNPIIQDAEADRSGAPYPLILTGTDSGSFLFKSHLATYGFVMVIVRSPGFSYTAPWNNAVIDGPLDFLFALDVLTSDPHEGLEGILDTERVGVAGYSSDGFFSLALSGARINPEYYFSQCANAPYMDPPLRPYLIEYFCRLSERWDEFSSQVDPGISTVSDGLWQPTTDGRILAAMPMAPDSAWLYGAEGLANINIPSIIIAGTADELVSYEMTSSYVYEHLVNANRILISFIDKGHMMVENREVIRRINHFAVAFFGYYLQGRVDYADHFSEKFVAQFNDLAWGVYKGD
jgi:predicted dienelactone hydrolase